MLLTDKEFLQLSAILKNIVEILGEGYKGKEGFIKKTKNYIKGTDIHIDTVLKVAARLDLLI